MADELTIRLSFFIGVLLIMAIWEILSPRRHLHISKLLRWGSNLGIVVINTAILRIVLPGAAVAMAVLAEGKHWGLLNQISLPTWLAVTFSVVALDFIIYWQHVIFHLVPWLWKLHLVHHADLDFDVTTGLRFHPIEILLSMVIKMVAVIILGTPAIAVIIFEVLLNATSMFEHSNIYLPEQIDRLLRRFMVTPDMHRVHHSVIPQETNSNFGFNLAWWDYLFKTYREQPSLGHDKMAIGLPQFQYRQVEYLHWMLILPFVNSKKPADRDIQSGTSIK
ncbi:MAG: sterol desaturase family protein [Cyanosarcina radialis HA8281-LM2]|jgi:sterol desaturase/sphingolipid hydroxylase (fatty acid hydroxylase superfamily)|nr:sterol desaturase family protein [Cyanosarcina radialis HA8281-LM2]